MVTKTGATTFYIVYHIVYYMTVFGGKVVFCDKAKFVRFYTGKYYCTVHINLFNSTKITIYTMNIKPNEHEHH